MSVNAASSTRSRSPRAASLVVAATAPAPRRAGSERAGAVTAAHLRAARASVAQLPAADRALLRRHDLRVELVPAAALEQGMLGATTVVRRADGALHPTRIRVAAHLRGSGAESLAEVVQHEVGHAVAVLRRQDSTEDAAEAYARRH